MMVMAKQTDAVSSSEKIFTIPLREAYKKANNKRTPYAARLVRAYLKTHTKANIVKMGQHLNEELWKRSIAKPPRRVRVKAIREGDVVKAELMGYDYVEFKAQPKKERKDMKERLIERMGPKALKKEEEEKKIEGKETPEKAVPTEKHEVGEGR